jgi:signal peptidase
VSLRSRGVRIVRALLDLVLVAVVLVVASAIALDRLVPMTGGTTLIVGGPSMEPTIHLGSAVVTHPVDPERLAVGDVVSIRVGPSHAVFTHRIVQLLDRPDGRWLRTKGDGNADPDPAIIPATAVIGRVSLVVAWAGYLLALLSHVAGVFGVGALLLGLILTGWLFDDLVDAADRGGDRGFGRTLRGAGVRQVRARSLGALAAPIPRLTRSMGAERARGGRRPGAPLTTGALAPRPAGLPLAAAPIEVGDLVRALRLRRQRRRRWAEAGRPA